MTGNRKWRFSFWPVLAFLAVLPGLIALGAWQVDRGMEKRRLHADFQQGREAAGLDVTGLPLQQLEDLPDYRRIELRGRYLSDRQFLLDNMPRDGRPGHHVLTPFLADDADYAVMVDRGWREGMAGNASGTIPIIDSAQVISGMLAPLPRPALRLEGRPVYEGWPRVVQFPTAREFSDILEMPVAESRLLLDESVENGFRRDWKAPGIPPARHFAYAFQWFALAAALIVIFVVMARPRNREKKES